MSSERTERWSSHPGWAGLVRFAIFAIPFATAMVVAVVLSSRLPMVESTSLRVVRWLGIVVVSSVAMVGVDRVARRLLPLSVLLKLTLVFPDQAPSRFRLAMRTGTTRELRERIEAARTPGVDETPSEAAERLLELVGLLSHHDRLTRGHSERVRAYTHLIGEEMGLTETELDKIRWAGLLHDIGKTAVPTEILNKPGRLTDEEFDTIKTHPDEGRALVEPLADWLGESLRAVWEHHERFDGTGYPRGLAGLDISLAARIVSVADSYDVMTSARSYKQPMSPATARAELAVCAGTQFDPTVVRSFLNISLGRLRMMTGPLAWFAQLALFEPTGVVHAGNSVGQGGGVGASGATGGMATTGAAGSGSALASTGAVTSTAAIGATSTAVGAGSASLVATVTAVSFSVAATTGIAVAGPDVADHGANRETEMVAAEQQSEQPAETLGAPTDTVIEVEVADPAASPVAEARVVLAESSDPTPAAAESGTPASTDDDPAEGDDPAVHPADGDETDALDEAKARDREASSVDVPASTRPATEQPGRSTSDDRPSDPVSPGADVKNGDQEENESGAKDESENENDEAKKEKDDERRKEKDVGVPPVTVPPATSPVTVPPVTVPPVTTPVVVVPPAPTTPTVTTPSLDVSSGGGDGGRRVEIEVDQKKVTVKVGGVSLDLGGGRASDDDD